MDEEDAESKRGGEEDEHEEDGDEDEEDAMTRRRASLYRQAILLNLREEEDDNEEEEEDASFDEEADGDGDGDDDSEQEENLFRSARNNPQPPSLTSMTNEQQLQRSSLLALQQLLMDQLHQIQRLQQSADSHISPLLGRNDSGEEEDEEEEEDEGAQDVEAQLQRMFQRANPAATTNNNNNNNNNGDNEDRDAIDEGLDSVLNYFTNWTQTSLPFFVLLLLLFIYQHREGIFMFLWLSILLIYSSKTLKKQIALKENKKKRVVVGVAAFLFAHVLYIYFIYDTSLWRSLLLLPPSSVTIWETIWMITTNDVAVRFMSIIIKSFCVLLSRPEISPKRMAQLYSVVEVTSQLYRSFLPISVWFTFFTTQDIGFLSYLVAGVYLTFKSIHVRQRCKQFASTLKAFINKEVPFGTYASEEEVMEVGDNCAICQEKMSAPLKLSCKHIFCEACVSEWFEREKTCPLCRTVIHFTGFQTGSDGATSIVAQLF